MKLFFSRLNCWNIVKNHCKTFYDNTTQQTSWIEIGITVAFIILLASVATCFHCLTKSVIEIMLTAFSILSGFLISALFLLVDKADKQKGKDFQIIKETIHNISFGILIGVFIIVLSLFFILFKASTIETTFAFPTELRFFMSMIYFGLIVLFFHTLLIILQRVNKIFNDIL